MNKGIKHATGEVIEILNSDDYYVSDHIIDTVLQIFRAAKCDAVFGDVEFVSRDDKNKVVRKSKSSPYVPGSFRKGWHPPHPAFFVKTAIFKRHGEFDTNFNVFADFELMLRFMEKRGIKTVYIDAHLSECGMAAKAPVL